MTFPQPLHFPFLPAARSGTVSEAPHSGQLKVIGIGAASRMDKGVGSLCLKVELAGNLTRGFRHAPVAPSAQCVAQAIVNAQAKLSRVPMMMYSASLRAVSSLSSPKRKM